MHSFFMHLVVYVAVNGLLVAIWVLFGEGSAAQARQAMTSLDAARDAGFWPMYVMVFWGAGLLIHLGAALTFTLARARRQRRKRRRAKADQRRRLDRLAGEGADSTSGSRSSTKRRGSAAGDDGPDRAPDPGGGRRWVAVMFTDVVGSTSLAAELGDEGFAEALRLHRAGVRSCVAAHGGQEVGTQGDGFLLRFDSPDDAASCAVELQRLVHTEAAGPGTPPSVRELRIGIHAGEVVHDNDDDDLVGRVVNLASRVTDVADAGEILVTESVADHLALDVAVTDRGLRELKGFDRPRHLLSLVWQDSPDRIDLSTES